MQSNATVGKPSGDLVAAARQRARRYRLAAAFICVMGVIGAGTLYWVRSGGPDFSDNPAMSRFNRAEQHQLGVLYGKQGRLVEDLSDSLKQPGTQAILVLAAAAIGAAGCFYFARILEDEVKR